MNSSAINICSDAQSSCFFLNSLHLDMEDEHIYKLCLNDEKDMHYFAVFDGHGGQAAAQYASKQLDLSILGHSAFSKLDFCSCISEVGNVRLS